ncbi:MAG: FtsX-like permease family protein [Wenzhouxiangellaceae bacterium]
MNAPATDLPATAESTSSSQLRPWRLAWRLWRRERRSGPLRTLFWSLVVATIALTAVMIFGQRLQQALNDQAGELLAADLVLASRQPIPPPLRQLAADSGLSQGETILFPTVVFATDNSLLVSVKAVSENYPLRGQLRISDRAYAEDRTTASLPGAGEAWAESRLLSELGIQVGDQIDIGESQVTITQALTYEPDRAGNFYSLAPRLLITTAQARAAGLVGIGARLNYQLLLNGDDAALSAYRQQVEQQYPQGIRVRTVADAQDRGNDALDQARRFLAMAALCAVLLAAVAIWLSAERYAANQRLSVALLRCMGEVWRPILFTFLFKVLYTAAAALPLGLLSGWLAHLALVHSMQGLTAASLPAAGWSWLPFVVLAVSILTAGFALPQIVALRSVPPRQVLHQDEERGAARRWWYYLPAIAALALLTLGQIGDLQLSAYLLVGAAVMLLILMLATRLIISLVRRALPNIGPAWRYAIGSIARRSRANALQTAAIGLGIAILLLLGVVRGELFATWQDSLPPETPNRFLLNIQPDQAADLSTLMRQGGIEQPRLEPLAIGRIVTINGETPDPQNYEDPLAEARLSGTTNLSWREDFPAANTLSSGSWWDDDRSVNQVSLSSRLADPLGLKVGDQIGFQIGAVTVDARITSIREVEWDSFQVNFFILLNPEAASDVPHTLITSFYLPVSEDQLLRDLARRFPNVSILDTEAILQRIRDIIAQVSRAAQVVFLFTLAAGILVLITAIQAARGERRKEAAILRTLGASRRFVRNGWLLEYALMGTIAGSLAAIFAWLIGWLLSSQLFDLQYQPQALLFIIGAGSGLAVVTATGWLGNRKVLQQSPLSVLRAA